MKTLIKENPSTISRTNYIPPTYQEVIEQPKAKWQGRGGGHAHTRAYVC